MKTTVLVATDGTPGALGALRMARALEARGDASVRVIGVVEPIPAFDVGMVVTLPDGELSEARVAGLERDIREQIAAVAGREDEWPLEVEAGVPGPHIARRAAEVGAHLLLLGLGRHRTVDRLLGSETALQVVRLVACPVVAVPAEGGGLPRTAVAAVDFSEHSRSACMAAAQLLDVPGRLVLAHVMQGLRYLRDVPEGWEGRYREEVERRLDEFRRGLEVPGGIELRTAVLDGDPARELLALAAVEKADLLAAGTHGHAFVARLLLGSVSTRLLRGASIATLVAPPEMARSEEAAAGEHPWAVVLDEFTRKHAGRPVTLEVIDPDLGAQITGSGFPLRGIDYDPRSRTLHIMLGPLEGAEGHVTHSIQNPAALEVAVTGGRHESIRVGLARGEMLLRIRDS